MAGDEFNWISIGHNRFLCQLRSGKGIKRRPKDSLGTVAFKSPYKLSDVGFATQNHLWGVSQWIAYRRIYISTDYTLSHSLVFVINYLQIK
jgi:hypothetical protein